MIAQCVCEGVEGRWAFELVGWGKQSGQASSNAAEQQLWGKESFLSAWWLNRDVHLPPALERDSPLALWHLRSSVGTGTNCTTGFPGASAYRGQIIKQLSLHDFASQFLTITLYMTYTKYIYMYVYVSSIYLLYTIVSVFQRILTNLEHL